MAGQYDTIILSPHFDDAAISCGASIRSWVEHGEKVLVVTVHGGIPTGSDEEADYVRRRREEDEKACRILGCEHLWMRFEDAIHRDGENGRLYENDGHDVFTAPIRDSRRELSRRVSAIRELPSARQIFAPLAIGHHVDHRLTKEAAEAGARSPLFYYEDFPYLTWDEQWQQVMDSGLGLPTYWVERGTDEAWQKKWRAIQAYESQLSDPVLFGDPAVLKQNLDETRRRLGGERYWVASRDGWNWRKLAE